MNATRIFGVILRYMMLLKRNYDRLSDYFFWPTVDLLLFGLTSVYFVQIAPEASKILLIIVSGILLWLVVWRCQYEITLNLLEEFWNRNFINIFVSPVTFAEWYIALLILGIIKAAISFTFASLLAFWFYGVEVLNYGLYLFPFWLLLVISGWAIGSFVAGMILRFGSRIQTFAWTFAMVLSPFSAVYYPLLVLPLWAQKIGQAFPMVYVFEGAREVVGTGSTDLNKLGISLILCVIYLSLTFWFLRNSFRKAMDRGLINTH